MKRNKIHIGYESYAYKHEGGYIESKRESKLYCNRDPKEFYYVWIDTIHPDDKKTNFCKQCYEKAYPKPKIKA